MEQKEGQQFNVVEFALAVLGYLVVSIGIVYVNSYLFKSVGVPLFVTFFQMVVAAICSISMGALRDIEIAGVKPLGFWCKFSLARSTFLSLFPLAASYIAMVCFNNLCLKYVLISTYQVARSSTILFNIVLTYYVLKTAVTKMEVLACAVVCSGVVVGSLDPSTLSMLGVLTGTLGSFFWALYSVFVKRFLELTSNDQFVLLNYNLVWALIMLVPVVLVSGETALLTTALPWNFAETSTWNVWGLMVLSGLLGFGMNISVFCLIKTTSPLSYNIIGTGKACLQTAGGFIFFKEIATPQSVGGIALSIGGGFFYGFVKLPRPTESRPSYAESVAKTLKSVVGKGNGRQYEAVAQLDWREDEEIWESDGETVPNPPTEKV